MNKCYSFSKDLTWSCDLLSYLLISIILYIVNIIFITFNLLMTTTTNHELPHQQESYLCLHYVHCHLIQKVAPHSHCQNHHFHQNPLLSLKKIEITTFHFINQPARQTYCHFLACTSVFQTDNFADLFKQLYTFVSIGCLNNKYGF